MHVLYNVQLVHYVIDLYNLYNLRICRNNGFFVQGTGQSVQKYVEFLNILAQSHNTPFM